LDRILGFIILAQEGLGGAAAGGAPSAGAASDAAGNPAAAPQGGGFEPIIFLVLMLVVFYFFLIRPQQKRAKKHKALVESLKRGDTVITSSGIYGRIVAIEGNVVTLEIAKNTRIKVLRNFVGGIADESTEKELAQQTQN
jgi:preprotein translocase subunit YajC